MKKIVCIVFLLLLSSIVQGQQSNCFEAAGISTNPADPVNSQCDGDFLNTFDWMQEKFKVEDLFSNLKEARCLLSRLYF